MSESNIRSREGKIQSLKSSSAADLPASKLIPSSSHAEEENKNEGRKSILIAASKVSTVQALVHLHRQQNSDPEFNAPDHFRKLEKHKKKLSKARNSSSGSLSKTHGNISRSIRPNSLKGLDQALEDDQKGNQMSRS